MSPTRARELLDFGETAIADAHAPDISAWRRLQATYDATVCAVAILAATDIQATAVEDEEHVLEWLLDHSGFDVTLEQSLRVLASQRRTPHHLTHRITDSDVERALRSAEKLHRQARSKIAGSAPR